MVNESKKNDPRFWKKWRESGALANKHGQVRGEAYAFFDCNAPITQIADEIPFIRDLVKTPRRLDLYLAERTLPLIGNSGKVDSELAQIAMEAKDADLKYVLAARSTPNRDNRQTADELAGILNQAYQSPLYQDKEPFRGGIFFERDGHYVSRD